MVTKRNILCWCQEQMNHCEISIANLYGGIVTNYLSVVQEMLKFQSYNPSEPYKAQ
jgi:hypothetical protein